MSIAVSSSALAIATANNSKLKKIECQNIVSSFDSKNANIESMKEYSSCIELLYPTTYSEAEIILLKIVCIVALIGFIIGFIHAKRDNVDFIGYAVYPIMWFICLPIFVSLFVGIGYIVYWLFK